MNPLVVKPVENIEDRKAFLSFPWKVYKDDPYWVPPIFSERLHFTDPKKNPFFEHSEAQLYMALRGDEIVGTIAAFTNGRHNEFQNENVGFFGFFEVLEDYEAAEALLKTAENWAREKGHTALRGPAQWNTNDECGLLVDGFDDSPRILMTYNPRYYVDFVEKAGFKYARDLWAYQLPVKDFMDNIGERLEKITTKILERKKITLRRINMKIYDEEVAKVKLLYNEAWSQNWGFVPMTDGEFDQLADELHDILDPDLTYIAEKDGKTVGFSITLPDLNEPLLKAYPKPNSPEWWTMLKLVWNWKVLKKVSWVRVLVLGVIPEYRTLGIDALFYYKSAQAAIKKGMKMSEMSWILDNNDKMNRPIIAMGAEVYKTYRFYEKTL
ncbi:MAG TPA: N-acetyltransferase [Chloroflexi bacterium]|nr:N-acetyltransferase [Chloroflexota bacterium]